MRTLDCDVLIIGSGAGGGGAGATLSEQTGARIVLVERGGTFAASRSTSASGTTRRLYAGQGARDRRQRHPGAWRRVRRWRHYG